MADPEVERARKEGKKGGNKNLRCFRCKQMGHLSSTCYTDSNKIPAVREEKEKAEKRKKEKNLPQ